MNASVASSARVGVVFLEVFGASEIVPLQFIIGMKRGKVLRYAGKITAILRNNMDFNSLVPRLFLHCFPLSLGERPTILDKINGTSGPSLAPFQ